MTTDPHKLTGALSPDLARVRGFMLEQVAAGHVEWMADCVLSLLERMREVNHELIQRDAARRRAKPPSETWRRLTQEDLFAATAVANDNEGASTEAAGTESPASTNTDDASERGATPSPEEQAAKLLKRKKRGPKKRHEHGRSTLPAHLQRMPTEHLVQDAQRTCPRCHVPATRVRFRPSEVLELAPAQYIVRRDLCETLSCPGCRQYMVTAQRPEQVVAGGLLGDTLLVEAMVEHYGEAVPYERMERRAKEQGVPLRATTLARGVGRLVDLFDPVVDEIARRVAASSDLGLDATSTRVLDPDHPLGIRYASLYLLTGDHEYALFRYASSADAEALMAAFKDVVFKNARLTCDASPTMNCLEREGAIRAGCNAHGRRGLVYALRRGDLRAAHGIALYGTLFHIEAESKRLGESYAQRHERRRSESRPVAAALREWLDTTRPNVEPKSLLGKALGYLHRQWNRLMRFLDEAILEMSNNEVERDLRTHVLNRKSWYFCGDDASARRMANALTLIITCRKMGIPPRAYLRDTIARILRGDSDLGAMMPDAFARRWREERKLNDLRLVDHQAADEQAA